MLELIKNKMFSKNFTVARWHHICKDTKLEQNCLYTALKFLSDVGHMPFYNASSCNLEIKVKMDVD